jgi:hypothetical protein
VGVSTEQLRSNNRKTTMTMKKHMTIVLLLAALTLGPPLIMPASGQSVGQVHKKAAHATNKILKKTHGTP